MGKNEFNIEGQMLHAHRLEFKHPITEKGMCLEAPLPEYFANVLSDLRNRGKIEMEERLQKFFSQSRDLF